MQRSGRCTSADGERIMITITSYRELMDFVIDKRVPILV